AFIRGLTGQFSKQFAITIAISTVISAFNSLTLSPALCAVLLQPHRKRDSVAQASSPAVSPASRPAGGVELERAKESETPAASETPVRADRGTGAAESGLLGRLGRPIRFFFAWFNLAFAAAGVIFHPAVSA